MLSLLRRLKIIFMSELEGVKQLIAIVLLKEYYTPSKTDLFFCWLGAVLMFMMLMFFLAVFWFQARREKISERMTLLQDLVPGCNRITGKAVMLDEIINYVQSLQRQVEVWIVYFINVLESWSLYILNLKLVVCFFSSCPWSWLP